ncbi:hypothetical protein DAI22_01g226900 [Oryza sativa Japonica Group]|nr:hypothetical protein DAI22_01g226900 [Oryza sativa Japonica Group]
MGRLSRRLVSLARKIGAAPKSSRTSAGGRSSSPPAQALLERIPDKAPPLVAALLPIPRPLAPRESPASSGRSASSRSVLTTMASTAAPFTTTHIRAVTGVAPPLDEGQPLLPSPQPRRRPPPPPRASGGRRQLLEKPN